MQRFVMNNDVIHLANGDFEIRPAPNTSDPSNIVRIRTDYGKTLAKGSIEGEPPPAATLEEVQESWHTAKNFKTPRQRD